MTNIDAVAFLFAFFLLCQVLLLVAFWLLITPLAPMPQALFKSNGEPNDEMNTILGFYGYLVICGLVFNALVLVAFVCEVFR